MSAALLDVNVLLALFDSGHVHHEQAHAWFRAASHRPWATCPASLNGCLRIFSQFGYANTRTPALAARMLHQGLDHPQHEFWPDSVSVLDDSLFCLEEAASGRQISDIYLLGLAVRRGGHLVTFDRSIPLKAVLGSKPSHLKILRS